MLHAWRWYGPDDPVSLDDVRQAGATDVVSALHHVSNGEVWTPEAIETHRRRIEEAPPGRAPLRWSVVESVPVHEAIKTGAPDARRYVEAYRETLRHLGAAGISTVCYNFMPVVDWTRTDLAFELPDGSRALRYDAVDMAAFDLHLLQREGAGHDYDEATRRQARERFEQMPEDERARLERTILAGLPGSEEHYTLESFREVLRTYRDVDAGALRRNLIRFLEAVVPAAEDAGVRLAIHPDDPPFPILGLPRVVSTAADVEALFDAVPAPANGLTFCTGSFGVRPDNDLAGMARRFAPRIHFAHLRSTRREADGSFFEADHLDGDVDMPAVVRALLHEERRRAAEGRADAQIPMRPDHGHQMLGDLQRETNPGYSAVGRLRGLAELRGLERGLRAATA